MVGVEGVGVGVWVVEVWGVGEGRRERRGRRVVMRREKKRMLGVVEGGVVVGEELGKGLELGGGGVGLGDELEE
ncbi:hypothetical protein [Pseudomonas aeruginosa]|uniref:hypothetical protein n=1 Tax=Pseudomonas aeruginosa TaxID=287 RepID=UPI0024BE042A|nr:hypothetical protein [Pseudomonas aeruginosa]MDJ1357974.1 hypothetical protein [Pseudomonas aeruginosa]